MPLLVSDFPHFFIWCLLWMLFTVPFACCCTIPLWKKGMHSSQSLTHSRRIQTAGWETCRHCQAVSILRRGLKQSCRRKESEKSETEVNSISNITLNVTLSFALKDFVKELPGSLISEEPVKFMVVQLHGHLTSIMIFSLDFTCTSTLSLQPSPFPARRG